jgi:pyruvate carboxylase
MVPMPIKKVLVANRGEIAVRVFRTCDEMGIATCAVYTTHDDGMPHMTGREAKLIDNYLNIEEVIAAAKEMNADAIHPGYVVAPYVISVLPCLNKLGICTSKQTTSH